MDAQTQQDRRWLRKALQAEYERYWKRYLVKEAEIAADALVNPFALAMHDETTLTSHRMGRAADSILGNTMESLAHRLVKRRYPDAAPQLVLCGSVTERQARSAGVVEGAGTTYVSGARKTVLVSDYDHEVVRTHAAALARCGHAVGSDEFQQRLDLARDDVRAVARQDTPWAVIVDLFCSAPQVGMGEIKMGGQLDNTKARIEVQELIAAALVCDEAVPVRAFICYANRGYGNTIAGALPAYFTGDRLLVERDFWNRLLPETVSWEDFLKLTEQASAKARRKAEEEQIAERAAARAKSGFVDIVGV